MPGDSTRTAGTLWEDVAEWNAAGISSAEAAWWESVGVYYPDAALAWKRSGRPTDEIAKLARASMSSPDEADVWEAAGFSTDEAVTWRDQLLHFDDEYELDGAPITIDEIATWKRHEFTPRDVDRWRCYGFDPDLASAWRTQSIAPHVASEMIQRGLTPHDAREEIDGEHRRRGHRPGNQTSSFDSPPTREQDVYVWLESQVGSLVAAIRRREGLHDREIAGVVRTLASNRAVIAAYGGTTFKEHFARQGAALVEHEAHRTRLRLGTGAQMKKALHHLTQCRITTRDIPIREQLPAQQWISALEREVGARFGANECGCQLCAARRTY